MVNKKNQLNLEEMLAMVYALAVIIKADSIIEVIKEVFCMTIEQHGNLIIVWSSKHIRGDVYYKPTSELLFTGAQAKIVSFLIGYDAALATVKEDLNQMNPTEIGDK
jgi:hypothetical protein